MHRYLDFNKLYPQLLLHIQACNLSENSRTVIVDGNDVIAIYEYGKVFAS